MQEHFNDLVIATYGRGIWIMDDLTPLQQLTPQVQTADTHLFSPRAAYRLRDITPPASHANDPSAGENPPYGASITGEDLDRTLIDVESRLVELRMTGRGQEASGGARSCRTSSCILRTG